MVSNNHNAFEFQERIESLIDTGLFVAGSVELGVARYIVDHGVASLTSPQISIWEQGIAPALAGPLDPEHVFHMAMQRDYAEDWRPRAS